MDTPRKPKDDSAKRLKELQVSLSVWQSLPPFETRIHSRFELPSIICRIRKSGPEGNQRRRPRNSKNVKLSLLISKDVDTLLSFQ